MFRNSSADDKNKAVFSGREGNNLPLPGGESLIELSRLEKSKEIHHLNRPIGLEQFEMLEAELQNQGILSKLEPDSSNLSFLANQEATFWRWRAQRYGATRMKVSFAINVPLYIIQRAVEVTAAIEDVDGKRDAHNVAPWKFSFRTQKSLLSELRYLNSFAAYINGAYDKSKNRYQRGCNLILQVLAQSSEWSSKSNVAVTLPVSKDEFLRRIKPFGRLR